jgi:aminomethyltransferase
MTLYADDSNSALIGQVTSGGFGPSLNAPIAMGYVAKRFADPDFLIFADVRGRPRPVKVTALPFVPHRYKRN